MDANQPKHYPVTVYREPPPAGKPYVVTLCPAGRILARPALADKPSQVQCRRCRELLNVIGLSDDS